MHHVLLELARAEMPKPAVNIAAKEAELIQQEELAANDSEKSRDTSTAEDEDEYPLLIEYTPCPAEAQ